MTRTLSIVGAGKAGRTLARLWTQAGVFSIGQVINRTLESSRAAVAFLGQGTAAEALADFDLLLLSTSDAAIAPCAQSLASTLPAIPGRIVFHLSGSASSELLAPLRAIGCAVASLHPIRSFANPALAAESFAGTYCALEGDASAVALLRDAATHIGAHCFEIDPQRKLLYHAGSVFASNYVTAMLSAGIACLQSAGVAPELAQSVLTQIAQGTAANVAQLGPAQALTGPIARGEFEVVRRQLAAIEQNQPTLAPAYRAAGLLALELARASGSATNEALEQIHRLLQGSTSDPARHAPLGNKL